jgi:RNA polymerase sigma-70 factor, ECF subfamily
MAQVVPSDTSAAVDVRVIGWSSGVSPEEQAVRALYLEHGPAVYRYVLRMVGGDTHHAEDVLQETVLRCWRKRYLADDEGLAIRPYMFRIARNLVIDEARARKARPLESGDTAGPAEPVAEGDDIDRLLSSLVLAQALATLTPAHREIIQATFLAGHTIPQAATTLGIPRGTAKSRAHFALRRLRAALHERGMH